MIALLTDFGLTDIYVGVMKAVILGIAPDAVIIDLTHKVPAQSIAVGALQLAAAWDYLPSGTIVVGVVDPGVGGIRRAVAAQIAGKIFVGPDNGLISRLADDESPRAVELTQAEYQLTNRRRNTFHGRDIFAPAAAHLASGVPLETLGNKIDGGSLVRFSNATATCAVGELSCSAQVAFIDHFGNIVLDLTDEQFQLWRGESLLLTVQSHGQNWSADVAYATHYDSASNGLIVLVNSYGLIEIAKPTGSAAKLLPVGRGDYLILVRR